MHNVICDERMKIFHMKTAIIIFDFNAAIAMVVSLNHFLQFSILHKEHAGLTHNFTV